MPIGAARGPLIRRKTADAIGPSAYVDNAATGANNGTSWANAWQSFAAINWGVIVPGTTIYISGGSVSKTYAGSGLVVGAAGTLGSPITITRGVDAGHSGVPILDGQNTGSRWYGIDNGWSGAAPKNYVTVSRLSLRNFESAGLHARNTTAGVVFEDNDVLCGSSTADDPRGIDVRLNTGIIVRDNRVTTPTSAAGETDGLFSAANQDFLYENNTITISNTDDTGHSDCFQIDGDGNGIVRNNVFIGAPAGANNHVVWMHAIQTGAIVQFYNNVCVSRGTQHNVTYWRELAGSGNGTVLLYNNTIYHGLRAVNLERVTLVEIKNNIIWPDDLGVGVMSSLNDLPVGNVSHNLVWVPNANAANTVANGDRTYAQWTATDGYNANGVNADPLFVNADGGDFTLQNGSPAIDAGVTLVSVSTDLAGAVRPQGAAYDIGAYDRAPWTPANFPSLTGWWSMETHAGQTNGTDLTQFTDLSGNGRHFDQRVAGNLPDKETVSTFAAADFLASNSESMDTAATLATLIGNTGLCAVVFEMTGTPGSSNGSWYENNIIVGDAGGFWGIAAVNFAGTTPSIRFGIWDGDSEVVRIACTTGVRHLALAYQTSGNIIALSIDGGADTTDTVDGPPSTLTGVMYLGVNYGLGSFFNGRIHEVVISTSNGTSDDRLALIAYLKTKWGIA